MDILVVIKGPGVNPHEMMLTAPKTIRRMNHGAAPHMMAAHRDIKQKDYNANLRGMAKNNRGNMQGKIQALALLGMITNAHRGTKGTNHGVTSTNPPDPQ
jgi:hypothetical protein